MSTSTTPSGAHQAAQPIVVDPAYLPQAPTRDDGDGSSSYEDATVNESTATLSSSILNYREVHGRTYQNFKDAEYWQPNDEKHNDSLDLNHHMMLLLNDNKLFHAPIKNPQAVLDVGTGTGIWAIDFADQFPSASVIGTDLSPIQPEWAPPNCRFELDDACLSWTFEPASFDFIHIRYMLGSIADWPALYAQAFRALKPGGWIEHTEFTCETTWDDNSLPPENIYTWWTNFLLSAGDKIGRTFTPTKNGQHLAWLKEVGFTGAIHTKAYKVPLGTWPKDPKLKEIGMFNRASCEQGLEGFGIFLGTQVMGYSMEEMQVTFAKVREALANPTYHPYYPCDSAWAQKPLDK